MNLGAAAFRDWRLALRTERGARRPGSGEQHAAARDP